MVELSDETGAKAATYEYDSYGNEVSQSGGEENAYRFSTKEYSSLTGLIYFGARYYDPEVGRFITRDPLGFAGGINQYVYCEADPVNWVDPWGLCKGEEGWGKTAIEFLGLADDKTWERLRLIKEAFSEGEWGSLWGDIEEQLSAPLTEEQIINLCICFSGGVKSVKSPKTIVIGESMGRVKNYARSINAKWYQAWGKNFSQDMTRLQQKTAWLRNKQWLLKQVKQKAVIVDIGYDLSKTSRSVFYRLERMFLQKIGYSVKRLY